MGRSARGKTASHACCCRRCALGGGCDGAAGKRRDTFGDQAGIEWRRGRRAAGLEPRIPAEIAMSSRRSILKTMAAAAALSVCDAPFRYAFASLPTERRLVVVILRGALDGLAAVPPHGDADYASVRGSLALDKSSIHDLDGFFGLHPALTNLFTM